MKLVKTLAMLFLLVAPSAAQAPLSAPVVSGSSATANFAGGKFTISPDLFGMNHYKASDQPSLQPRIVRIDYISHPDSMRNPVIPDTTVEAYAAALAAGCPTGSACNVNTWNFAHSAALATLMAAHAAGVRTLGIVSEWTNPPWNSWNHLGNGVPKNWDVYEDIVKKYVQFFTTDMIEVWNEPDWPVSLDITGSPYQTPQSAYHDIYYHTAHAIRVLAGNQTVPIGGPVVCCGDLPSYFTPIWNDARFGANHSWINFVSYHNYQPGGVPETAFGLDVKSFLQGLGADIPIYVSEWNADAACVPHPQDANDPSTVGFWGYRLIAMMNARDTAALYYANDSAAAGCVVMDANNNLYAKTRALILMNVTMALGAGNFQVVPTTPAGGLIVAQGAINSAGQYVMLAANYTSAAASVALSFTGLPVSGSHLVKTYLVDFYTNTGAAPLSSGPQIISDGTYSQSLIMPPNSVAGVLIN